jgi:pyruvate/2-oxoglutarate dehydrogenase complex dihydrolipoamide acyltransferase (E2) component
VHEENVDSNAEYGGIARFVNAQSHKLQRIWHENSIGLTFAHTFFLNPLIAKVVKWYKNEGDRVDFKDLICDIESDGSIFTISNEDEITALMGKISVAEDSQGVQPGDLLCTVFLAPKAGGQSSNEGHASEKSEVPAKHDVKKTPTERKIEEQADRLPPGATITMPKKASGEATNTSSIEQELPPGATLVMASNAAKDIDISIFKDLDGRKSNKLKGEATITVPDGMKTSKPEAQVQSRTAYVVQPSADEPPLPIPDVSASNNVTPVPIIGDSSPPASNAVVSASTDAMSPPGESSSNDPAPLVELDRSMFTKEKAINMPNMGKFRGESLLAESTLKVSIVILYIAFIICSSSQACPLVQESRR